jgi:hypothetical protein
MSDIVKDSFEKALGQKKVVFQQQKPLLNYELNLAQDILNDLNTDLTKFSLGNNFYGDSFKVTAGNLPNEIFINKGVFYHEGVALYLDSTKRESTPVAPINEPRTDYVYVEYKIEEVDSPIDPLIGFVTTREEQLKFDIKFSTGNFPSISEEEINFNSSDKSINLEKGFFPDWMRIPNTKFATTSANNSGSPFYTVVSSPNPRTIIVSEPLLNESLNDIRFRKLNDDLKILREFRAYRNKFFIIARLNRFPDINLVSNIEDLRESTTYNFVEKGCKVSSVGGLFAKVDEGSLYVGRFSRFIEKNQPNLELEDNSLNYVYVDIDGYVLSSVFEPTSFHVMLAEVTTRVGNIVRIEDTREFTPISYSNIFGNGSGTGETGFTSIVHSFECGEDILLNDAVYLSESNTIGRASSSTLSRMPCIGIATEEVPQGQVENIVTFGIITNSSWNWTPGETLFLSTSPGRIIKNNQVETTIGNLQFVQRIGFAISPTKIFVKPELMYVSKNSNAETPLIVLRENGLFEVMGPSDRISPDRLNFLAIEVVHNSTRFNILPGRYSIDNQTIQFNGQLIELGISGTTYKPKAIPENHFNKLYFTLDNLGVVKMYEGVPSSNLTSVLEPVIPTNEIPIAIINIQDDGNSLGGSIIPITRSNVLDKRSWLNLGSIDNSSFKPYYYNSTNILISKGEAWFNKYYVNLQESLIVPVSTTDGNYYIYLNLNNVIGSQLNSIADISSIFISNLTANQVDRRKFIPLAQYSVSSGIITRSSFKTYSSKFWEYRSAEFEDEQIFSIEAPVSGLTNFSLSYNFLEEDFLKITVNGIEVYESKDYTKNPSLNRVNFNYPILTGAEVRIRKV